MSTGKVSKGYTNRKQGVSAMNRIPFLAIAFALSATMFACTPDDVPLAGSDNTGGTAAGGATSTGGTTATSTSSAVSTGGNVGSGGTTTTTTTTTVTGPVCDENHLGTKDSLGRTCVKIVTTTTTTVTYEFVQVDTGTGGATGTGGNVGTGGNTPIGGAGGSTSLTGTINCNGYVFDKTWVGRPINNGTSTAQWCVNPVFLLATSDGVSSRGCPNSCTFRVYHEATLGPSCSLAKDWANAPLSVNGCCLPWDNVTGTIHMSDSYPGFSAAWAMYPDVAQNSNLPYDSKQWLEHGPNGFGLTFYVVNGVSFSKAAYGANY